MKQPFVAGNRIALLETGSEFFPALIADIATARREVHVETYIFENDTTGQAVAEALAEAAQRGVAVKLLVDGFGARDFPRDFAGPLAAAGVRVAIYRPEAARLRLRRNRLRRLHRKLAVIDGRIAFVGGINIIDDTDTPHMTPPRYDFAVRVEGPLLADIQRHAHRLWRLVRWAAFRRRPHEPPLPADTASRGDMAAAFVVRDNLRHRRDIEDAYLEAIAGAQRDILIASAYFLPGLRFRHALAAAAKRGVKVTVLLQGQVEYALLHYATQSLYGLLLGAGIRVHEYQRGFLHAKVAVIDGEWATVGSSNIDPFSLLLAREANVIVRDAGFAATLNASLQRALAEHAKEMRPEDHRRRPLAARMLSWFAYAMVRLMIGVTRYGGPDYRE